MAWLYVCRKITDEHSISWRFADQVGEALLVTTPASVLWKDETDQYKCSNGTVPWFLLVI